MRLLTILVRVFAVAAASTWQCGKPLSTDYAAVNAAFSTWKQRYLKTTPQSTPTKCCIRRPTNADVSTHTLGTDPVRVCS